MKINKLSICNFRQFAGEHSIYFSTDPEKKITVVTGESGSGKTTLIQCFKWILYGECNYKDPLNAYIKENMAVNEYVSVVCSMQLTHDNHDYEIKRVQRFRKSILKVVSDESRLTISIKDESGITKPYFDKDAKNIVKTLVHRDLFPYFFLEGESLNKVGENMSRGRSGYNNEFVKAIKGLLGFNYLYETEKHLKTVIKQYDDEISANTSNTELKSIIEEIQLKKAKINAYESRIENIKDEIIYNEEKRDEVSSKIQAYGDVGEKQKRSDNLRNEIQQLYAKIQEQKSCLMRKFSTQSIYLVMNALIPIAEKTLEDSDSVDKGIPGITVEAVEFMLNNHKCICGHELIEGSTEWNKLNDWLTYLPPNNIGYEIDRFKSDVESVKKKSRIFDEEYEKMRKDYTYLINKYNASLDEKSELDKAISGMESVSALKQQEKNYSDKIISLNVEKSTKLRDIDQLNKEISSKESERQRNIVLDEKVQRLNLYSNEAKLLKDTINRFCTKKEKEKKEKLQEAINSIFKEFYEENVEFILDENYEIHIKTIDSESASDFTSGGQDVAVALAFIGAIIKLISEKDNDPDSLVENDNIEDYPLVMDAPTSNFGMKQMKSFSEIMPKITEQIIVFINDKDGPILKSQMENKIGSEWILNKIDTHHVEIKEVKNNG
ncbi:MAG: AAA family ATPase [Bacilli bacterium]|nr:AAA family ATPase [Bacilli bacterium]